MKLIELHILQSFPVTCLNRDDVGAPKSAVFGGAPRARVSSQCWKRAIRQLAAENRPDIFAGKRGHFITTPLQSALEKEGVEPLKAQTIAKQIATSLGDQDKKYKQGHKTSVALYLSPNELEGIAKVAAQGVRENGKADFKKGSLKKAIHGIPPKDLADIAIFGRMVANDHSLMIEGAGLFSHALSTHRVNNDIDFFSAVDDLKPEEVEGAGHIGTLEFNSACYYRYIGINLDLLRNADHLGHFADGDIKAVLETFLNACILAVPVARRNSMLGHNPPAFVLGLVRTGQPLSLVNAFEKPIRSHKGYIEPSIGAMEKHYINLKKSYNLKADKETRIPDKDLNAFCEGILNHV
jgi:CRISPR system Cascade subunit CasC